MEAYLDIETTGLSPFSDIITVIGIYINSGTEEKVVQLVGEEVTRDNLLKALEGVDIIYTYNGARFDFPFIEEYVEIELNAYFEHRDLMYDCWNKNLYGGFKRVEEILGIKRELKEIDGRIAVDLWERYEADDDEGALKTLLDYNKEDVVNLRALKDKLRI